MCESGDQATWGGSPGTCPRDLFTRVPRAHARLQRQPGKCPLLASPVPVLLPPPAGSVPGDGRHDCRWVGSARGHVCWSRQRTRWLYYTCGVRCSHAPRAPGHPCLFLSVCSASFVQPRERRTRTPERVSVSLAGSVSRVCVCPVGCARRTRTTRDRFDSHQIVSTDGNVIFGDQTSLSSVQIEHHSVAVVHVFRNQVRFRRSGMNLNTKSTNHQRV